MDNTTLPSANITIQLPGGGAETHTDYTGSATAGIFGKNKRWGTILERTGAHSYIRRHPDGSKEVYAQAIGSSGTARRVFLSQVVDPQGNAVTLNYSTTSGQTTRISQIVDATGLVTTLTYAESGSPFLVTKVTDPFGRFATFTYQTIAGKKRLQTITDTIGIQSTFEYNANGQITALITPYGRTTFNFGSPYISYGLIRWIEAIDPQGSKERLEYYLEGGVTGVTNASAASEVPTVAGLTFSASDMDDRNTFYWDKKAWAMAPGDYSKAHVQHWLDTNNGSDVASGVLESEKRPFESRVWYRYPGQPTYDSMNVGTSSQPSTIARVVESEGSRGGTATQAVHMTYNDLGNPLTTIDPVGRETSVEYVTSGVGNGIDPTLVKQKVGGDYQTIQSFTYDPTYPAHRPKTVTDAAGQTTTLTYNGVGQLTSVTNPLSETITLTYGTAMTGVLRPKGKVYQITGPGTGNTISLEYDGYQRPRKVTDQSGHITLYDYDVFDRVTLITYPDASTEQFVYDRLDLFAQKDRQGRWTRTWHNALRQPVLTADAVGRTIQMEWCKCGALQKLTDGKNQTTSWKYDAQGRNYEKTYPDNRKESITYEPLSGQVATTKDAANQVKTFKYFLDGNQKSLTYSNLAPGTAATAGMSYTYDSDFDRPSTMTDGTGTTTFGYHPVTTPATLGALQLKTVNGPLTGDTDLITYTYDAIGRLKSNNIGELGTENTTTRNYDALGRIQSVINPLGTFGHFYVGATERTDYINYPNGQKTSFGYFPNSGDNRLQTITHLSDGSNPANILSKFDYTYNKEGSIATWQRQFGSDPATKFTFGYDGVDQLVSASLALVSAPNTLQERYSYQYDAAGNRTSAQNGSVINTATSNAANQITGLSGGGKLYVSGTTDEPATVKVNGKIANTTPAPENRYEAWADVTTVSAPPGTGSPNNDKGDM